MKEYIGAGQYGLAATDLLIPVFFFVVPSLFFLYFVRENPSPLPCPSQARSVGVAVTSPIQEIR